MGTRPLTLPSPPGGRGVSFAGLVIMGVAWAAGASAQAAGGPAQAGEPARVPVEATEDASGAVPRRIITLAPNAAQIICALGEGERIVGVDRFCVEPPELKDRPRIGGLFDPNLEKIVALRPDLLVLRGHQGAIEQLCRRRGIAVFYDRTERLADVTANVRALGELLQRRAEAEALARGFDERLEKISERYRDQPRPRVLLTVAPQADDFVHLLTAGKGTFLDEMIELAGGVNVFGQLEVTYPEVSLEEIIARRPEVIIEMLPEEDSGPATAERWRRRWQRLPHVPAVVSGRVHIITDDQALIPSLGYVEIIEKVARLIHAESDESAGGRPCRNAGARPDGRGVGIRLLPQGCGSQRRRGIARGTSGYLRIPCLSPGQPHRARVWQESAWAVHAAGGQGGSDHSRCAAKLTHARLAPGRADAPPPPRMPETDNPGERVLPSPPPWLTPPSPWPLPWGESYREAPQASGRSAAGLRRSSGRRPWLFR
ncbi:MAG TPA: helical backbone metal receptor [Phycisphaerae bacterium]|nr:helical backbone metal receptor [Phycisphaerae bacterium]HNU45204.1 helical backbone metal receptor [Phycisphaerae bacterium]